MFILGVLAGLFVWCRRHIKMGRFVASEVAEGTLFIIQLSL